MAFEVFQAGRSVRWMGSSLSYSFVSVARLTPAAKERSQGWQGTFRAFEPETLDNAERTGTGLAQRSRRVLGLISLVRDSLASGWNWIGVYDRPDRIAERWYMVAGFDQL